MDLKVRKHIYFYGRVQGVGFRYYAVQKAGQLGLAGWVRNCYDGTAMTEVWRWKLREQRQISIS